MEVTGLNHRISPSEIRLLLALSEPTSFSAVALELGITQSAVSKTILALEEKCGVELLSRGRFGCRPSMFLSEMQPALRRAKQALESLESQFYHPSGVLSGRIRIAGFRSAISLLLPPAVNRILERHPHLDISISTVREVHGGVAERVLQGRADLGLTSCKPPGLLCSNLLGSDRYVIVRSGARSKTPVGKNSTLGERLILWNENCSACVPEILASRQITPSRTVRVEDDSTLLRMILHGGGFTVMPRLATEPLPDGLQLRELNGYSRNIWLCGQPTIWSSMAGKLLRRAISSASKKLLTV